MLNPRTERKVLSLAACCELRENSRLGFASKVTAQAPGLLCASLQSTLGMHVSLRETRGGSRIQTWNRYAYVGNNPLSNVDLLGLDDQGDIFPDCWFSLGSLVQCATSSAAAHEYCVFIGLCGSNNSGGGGGTQGGSSSPSPSNPPSKPVNFPNETLGIPNGMNVNFGGPLGTIFPSGNCGNLGPCIPIGMGATGSINLDFSGQWGWLSGTLSIALAIDSQGCIAWTDTRGLGAGVGARGTVGVSGSVSDAKTVNDLGGPFTNPNLGIGEVVGVGGSVFTGKSPNGQVTCTTVGVGVSTPSPLPGSGSATVTTTTVHRIGRCGF